MLIFLKTTAWVYPALESVHIVGIGLLLGNLVALELRVFGRAATLPLQALAKLSLTLALAGFTLAALSGLLMFSTQPTELLGNRSFLIKMSLLAAAAANAAWFHGRRSLQKVDGIARMQMGLSTTLWIVVVFCGRWIAY